MMAATSENESDTSMIMINEECWVKSVFAISDPDNTGVINIEEFMHYLKSIDDSESQNAEKYRQLEEMLLLTTSSLPEIDYESYERVLNEWINIVKLTNSEDTFISQHHSSICSESHEVSALQFSFGVIESNGANESLAIDKEEINACLQSLEHQIKSLNSETESMKKCVMQVEESVIEHDSENIKFKDSFRCLKNELKKVQQDCDNLNTKFGSFNSGDNLAQQTVQVKTSHDQIQRLLHDVTDCTEIIGDLKEQVNSVKKQMMDLINDLPDIIDSLVTDLFSQKFIIESEQTQQSILSKNAELIKSYSTKFEKKIYEVESKISSIEKDSRNEKECNISAQSLSSEILEAYKNSNESLRHSMCYFDVHADDPNNNQCAMQDNDDYSYMTADVTAILKEDTQACQSEAQPSKGLHVVIWLNVSLFAVFIFKAMAKTFWTCLYYYLCAALSIFIPLFIMWTVTHVGYGSLIGNLVSFLTNGIEVIEVQPW